MPSWVLITLEGSTAAATYALSGDATYGLATGRITYSRPRYASYRIGQQSTYGVRRVS